MAEWHALETASSGVSDREDARKTDEQLPSGRRYPMNRSRLLVELGFFRAVLEPDQARLVGRAEECALHVDDLRVSRVHALLASTAEGWLLEDLRSTSGTWLAGDRVESLLITGPVEVRLGDPLSGALVRFELEAIV